MIMRNTINWFTRSRILIISISGFVIFIASYFGFDSCRKSYYDCRDVLSYPFVFSLIFVPVALFSLIVMRLNEATFLAWRFFSFWWVSLSLLITLSLPMSTHGMDFFPVTKGNFIFLSAIIYASISLLIIFYQSIER
jgi:hypothetical protein